MNSPLKTIPIRREEDAAAVRNHAREIAAALGLAVPDQARVAMAAAEIACNALLHAGGGSAEFSVDAERGAYTVRICDGGPGIPHLNRILNGEWRHRGSGIGMEGAQRLADDFAVKSEPDGGTEITISMWLPASAGPFTEEGLKAIAAGLTDVAEEIGIADLQLENRQMLSLLRELQARDENLGRLSEELEDTNRGVVALYAELEEKADRLRRSDQMKSRFLSHMSHEFRTPLSSVMALSRLLLDESDGKLTVEQRKQATFIRKSAEGLLELVNDLLDLARVEAGKSVVRPAQFQVSKLFGALRGVLRPLHTNETVELVFVEPAGLPMMFTDEAKVAQILRNFISNALKFTEQGSVTVWARLTPDGERVIFAVADTGIGIRPEDQERIFQEFGQIDTPIQAKVRGTGLGLPLSKGLAELLGGKIHLESRQGLGSTFFAEIPVVYTGADAEQPAAQRYDVLVIDNEEISRYLTRQVLGPDVTMAEAADGISGIELARRLRPRVIILDLHLLDMSGFDVLRQLKGRTDTRQIPVVILTATVPTPSQLTALEEAAEFLSKEILSTPEGSERLRSAIRNLSQAEQPRPGTAAAEAYR